MKKFFALLAVIVFSFIACELPQSVSIKTQAEYNFTIAKLSFDLSEFFNYSKLMGNLDNESMVVYDYNPDVSDDSGEIQKFLLEVPVQEVKIDLASYLDDLDVGNSVDDMSFDKEIDVPEVKSDINETVSLDAFKNEINSMVQFGGSWDSTTSVAYLIFVMKDKDKQDFSEITYKTGEMNVYFVGKPTKVALYHDKQFIAETEEIKEYLALDKIELSDGSFAIKSDYYCTLEINDATFFKEGMNLHVEGDVSNYIGRMEKGDISKAEGIAISGVEVHVNDITLDVNSEEGSFEVAVIGENSELSLSFDKPDEWKGMFDVKWDVSLDGGLVIPNNDSNGFKTDGLRHYASLTGRELQNKEVIVKPTVYVSTKDAIFDFSKTPYVKGDCKINSFEYVIVALPEGTKTEFEQSESLSDSMGEAVTEFTLGSSGIIGEYYNTLPQGNDFDLICNSGLLGISGGKTTLTHNSETSEENKAQLPGILSSGSGKKINPANDSLDFSAKFDFGLTDEEKEKYEASTGKSCIKVCGVKPGEVYYIGADLSLNLDWKEMSVDTKKVSKGEGASDIINTGIELSSMIKTFADAFGEDEESDFFSALTVSTMPLYIYCHLPNQDKFTNVKLDGNISIGTYNDDESDDGKTDGEKFTAHLVDGKEVFLFDENEDIKWQDPPKVEYDPNNVFVITDFSKSPYSGSQDLNNLFNSKKKGTFALNCENLYVSDGDNDSIITIKKEQLEGLDDEKSIAIEIRAFIVLPFNFDVGKGQEDSKRYYSLSLMHILDDENSNDDFFGRTEKLDTATVDSYASVIEIVNLGFKSLKPLPFECESESITSDLRALGIAIDFGGQIGEDILSFDNNLTYKLKRDKLMLLLNTYPLTPKIMLAFPKGSFKVRRNMVLEASITLGLKTDGTLSLDALQGGK